MVRLYAALSFISFMPIQTAIRVEEGSITLPVLVLGRGCFGEEMDVSTG